MIPCNFPGPPGCQAEGTERFMSAWYCPAHLPLPANISCSHSLAPSGQCAYCGRDTDANNQPTLPLRRVTPPFADGQHPRRRARLGFSVRRRLTKVLAR